MISVKLFLSLSCASAAFVSTGSRSLVAEFSRKRNSQNVEERLNLRMPVNLSKMTSMPSMPSIPNPLPFAFCDSLPENPDPNNFFNVVIRPIMETFTLENSSGFDKMKFEKMIATKDYDGISEAFKNGAIDFSYVPKTKSFARVILHWTFAERTEIMKKYFESGVIEKMVKNGSITYQDLIGIAVSEGNFVIANMAIDRLIEKYEPEINSPNYKTTGSSKNSIQRLFLSPSRSYFKSKPQKRAFFYCDRLDPRDMDKFNFYKKLYLILYQKKAGKIVNEPSWKTELRRDNIYLFFNNCDL